MPPAHTDEGLRAAREIRAELPQVSVLVLSQYVEVAYARELLAESAEGLGYLLKDRVADVDALEQLTPREREVLGLMAEGRSNGAIAAELVVSERAVEKHVTGIFSKLELGASSEDHAGCSRCCASSTSRPERVRRSITFTKGLRSSAR